MDDKKARIAVPGIQRAGASNDLIDPAPAFSFHIEVDHIIEARFLECSGLNIRRETLPHKEGGLNDGVHNLPGRLTYGNITLRHGITYSDALWEWYITGCEDGKVNYRSVTIYQYLPYTDRKTVRAYHLERAFPVTWTGPSLRTDSSEIAVESLEIAFMRLSVKSQ